MTEKEVNKALNLLEAHDIADFNGVKALVAAAARLNRGLEDDSAIKTCIHGVSGIEYKPSMEFKLRG